MTYITLVPAYNRDYRSQKEVRADWDAGKDFMIQDISSPFDGRYISIRDSQPNTTYNIRYKQLCNICVIKHKN